MVLSWCLHLFQFQNEGLGIQEILRELESQCLSEISAMLNGEISGQDLGELFFDCVDAEIKFYQWGGETVYSFCFISPQIPKHSFHHHPTPSCSVFKVALVFGFCYPALQLTVIITSTVSATAPPGGQTFTLFQQKALDKTVSYLQPSLL